MGEMKVVYSDKKVTPFGGMKLLKDFIDQTDIIKDLESVDLPYVKHQVLQSNIQLKTLRAYCFAIGSWITNHSNREVLNIALPVKRRAWINGLFENVKQSQLPFKYT